MIKKTIKILLLLLVLSSNFLVSDTASADQLYDPKCSNGACTTVSWNDTRYTTTFPPNQNITLTYQLYPQSSASLCSMSSLGNTIYHVVRHYTFNETFRSKYGSADYEYIGSSWGKGERFSYTFNSGPAGQKNRYQAIFFCSDGYLESTNNFWFDFNRRLNEFDNEVWETSEINIVTGQLPVNRSYGCLAANAHYACSTQSGCSDISSTCASRCVEMDTPMCTVSASVAIDKKQVKPNSTLTLTVSNPPPGWAAQASVNGRPLNLFQTTKYIINVTLTNGFNLSGDNKISVKVLDYSGGAIGPLESSFSVKVDANAEEIAAIPPSAGGSDDSERAGGVSPGSVDPSSKTGKSVSSKVDCDKNRNDKDCLTNPLPTDDLLDMLLRIVKSFLVILGGWSVAFIIIGGFRMVMSQGNSEAYEAAQKTITWAILGMVIALLSFSMVAIIQSFIGASVKPLN